MYNRFEHEQQIMKCWNVTDDLKVVLEATDDMEMPSESKDELQNMLIGLIAMYDRKFDMLFRQFEASVQKT